MTAPTSFRPTVQGLAALDRLAVRYGSRNAAINAALVALDNAPGVLAAETWDALAAAARRRLRRELTEPELQVCLQATRSWWVTGADAALIHHEIADMDPADLAGGDALFGEGPAPTAPVDLGALAAKLGAMPDADRAALTLACREWWASEPRPPLDAVLGGMLRGPRAN